MPVFSSALFHTPTPISMKEIQTSRKSWYKGGPYDSWTILGTGSPLFQSPPSQSKERSTVLHYKSSIERSSYQAPDPFASARADSLHHRWLSDDSRKQQKLIFFGVIVLTIVFPPTGLLALYGRFDNTISWYTHGELHSLTQDQRGILKQQLFTELVVYPSLIVTLAVYYSVHG